MSTVTQIGWFSKYNDVVKELHELRKENDKLQALADKSIAAATAAQYHLDVAELKLKQLKEVLK